MNRTSSSAANTDVGTAVEAMKSGAFHYANKPFDLDEMMLLVEKALANPMALAKGARVVPAVKNGKPDGESAPRMNYYAMSKDPIGTPEVRTKLTHDLYLSIMNIDEASQTVGLHLIINPMVGWIWICTGVMAFGGIMAVWPTKSRRNEAILRDAAQARGGEAVVES